MSVHTLFRRTTVQSTAETDNICEKRLNRQLSPSPRSQNRYMARADEEVTNTTASTLDQSSAAQESHPEVVTVPKQCWRSERVRESPAYLKDHVCDQTRDFKSFVAVITVISFIVC